MSVSDVTARIAQIQAQLAALAPQSTGSAAAFASSLRETSTGLRHANVPVPPRQLRPSDYASKTASIAAWSLNPSSRHAVTYSQLIVVNLSDAKM